MPDFMIVGNGLAGNVLALQLHAQNLSYHMISEPGLSKCSQIAAGLWNPIVFKRMTKSWKADELIPELKLFYKAAETILSAKFYTERHIIKPFFSNEEKEFWNKKSETDLSTYIDHGENTPDHKFKNFTVPDKFGIVKHCGNIHMRAFLNSCDHFHKKTNSFQEEVFDHSQLSIKENEVIYKNISAKNIIFCEGYMVKNNPYFNWIPLNPVKGEVLEIDCEDIDPGSDVFNRNGFIFKLNESHYKVGATYDWGDLSDNTTEKGLNELEAKLLQMIHAPYSILKHEAGVRPSSTDRRPIIGSHPLHKNLYIFNGLGTKGVMLAPYFAKNFVNFCLKKEALHSEVNIERFYSKYGS